MVLNWAGILVGGGGAGTFGFIGMQAVEHTKLNKFKVLNPSVPLWNFTRF